MRVGDDVFHSYIARYREAIEVTRYGDLPTLQAPPFASLANGGAGTAYVLDRLGQRRRAQAWIARALADRRPAAYRGEIDTPDPASYLFGRTGVHWVRALVTRDGAGGFVRAARRASPDEFVGGRAGTLTAATILLARRDDASVRRLAAAVAAHLGEQVRARVERPWNPLDAVGFAHHWPGVLHALLAWSRLDREAPAAWLTAALRGLVAVWSPATVRVARLHGSWCNGLAGAVVLWTRAFDATRDGVFLAAARSAATPRPGASTVGSDLCCGIGGVAYALLELDRVDPTWRDQARVLAARAIDEATLTWPNGLFRGHPGLVCLASDLVAERPIGFPAVEA